MKQIRLLRNSEIECRIGMINEKGLSLLLYKDARVDMKILDETYGAMNWQRSHQVIGGNLYCTVSIWDDEKKQWIAKMDVGTESYTEKEKGQSSDSFKRACTVLGIGRELYSAGFIWIPATKANVQKRGDKYYTYDKFSVHQIAYDENREICELVIVNQHNNIVYALKNTEEQNQTDEKVEIINRELVRTGVALEAVLQRYSVRSIQEMSEDVYGKAISSLKRTKSRIQTA